MDDPHESAEASRCHLPDVLGTEAQECMAAGQTFQKVLSFRWQGESSSVQEESDPAVFLQHLYRQEVHRWRADEGCRKGGPGTGVPLVGRAHQGQPPASEQPMRSPRVIASIWSWVT